MLCNEFDPDRKALINPEEHLSPIPGFPEICILAFSSHIVEKCLERYGGEQIAHVPFCTGPVPLYRVVMAGTPVVLASSYTFLIFAQCAAVIAPPSCTKAQTMAPSIAP